MGSGSKGVRDIKEHPYFANIDWERLEQKHVEPPFKPISKSLAHNDSHRYPSFDSLLNDIGKSSWKTDLPDSDEQKYFTAW